jgi:ABC-type sugar transport system permease subunit
MVNIKKIKNSSALRGWLLVLPALLIFIGFYVGPAIIGLRMSLYEWDGLSPVMKFVNLDNYIRLFSTQRFWNDVWINLIVLISSLIFIFPIAILLALVLSKRGFGMKFFRNAMFFPQMLSIATIALIWTLIYDPYLGLLNRILEQVGLSSYTNTWLGSNNLVLICVIVAIIWASIGFHVVLFIAGLSGIPEEYFDAIKLETNNQITILRYVTLPLLRETIFISFVVIVGSSFGHSTGLVFLLTNGGPNNRTELLGLYGYNMAFRGHQFGYSSAISLVILFIVMLLVIIPTIQLAKDKLEY